MRAISCLLPAVLLLLLTGCKKERDKDSALPVIPVVFAPATSAMSTDFKGLNWADERDNFADDDLVLSGTTAADDAVAVAAKANTILSAFKSAGANTVRLPVNPSTAEGNRWQTYKAAIDKALDLDMKVVLAYWEGATSKDGLVDNTYSFWRMWDSVTTAYSANGNVYFEVMNEPHGYNLTDLNSLYASFLSHYPSMPKARIVLDGAGYSTDVNGVGSDSRFDSCLLSFHFYSWFDNGKQTAADWEQSIRAISDPARTIVTEFGVPMTGDKDYIEAPGTDREVSYLQGMTNGMHDLDMGGIDLPGLRTNDSYGMFAFSGSALTASNASGLSRLRYAWGEETIVQPLASFATSASYKIINRNSSKSLDVNNSALDDGASIIQWDYWGGTNQQWQLGIAENGWVSITNLHSGKALETSNASPDAGNPVVQGTLTGNSHQQWQVVDIGFGFYTILNKLSNLSLDINGGSTDNGGSAIQWYRNGGANQQWQITEL